jgi:hypothetical protein
MFAGHQSASRWTAERNPLSGGRSICNVGDPISHTDDQLMRVAILDDIHHAYEATAGVRRLRERAEVLLAYLDGREVARFLNRH